MAQSSVDAIVTDLKEIRNVLDAAISQALSAKKQVSNLQNADFGNASLNDHMESLLYDGTWGSAATAHGGVHMIRKRIIEMCSNVDIKLSLTE